MLIDHLGQPLEFVHNSLETPSGILWPETEVRKLSTVALCHSLFDACRREPEILVCMNALADAEFLRTTVAPAIPFAQAGIAGPDRPNDWSWIGTEPARSLPAVRLWEDLVQHGFVTEPFERITRGLREVYPRLAEDSDTSRKAR